MTLTVREVGLERIAGPGEAVAPSSAAGIEQAVAAYVLRQLNGAN